MKIIFRTLLLTLLTTTVHAAVKCPEAHVQMVYETEEKLFIQLSGGPWHVLAVNGENDYERKMARAMRARNKDLKVELTFDNGYDESCLSSNTDFVVKNIKLIKKERYKES